MTGGTGPKAARASNSFLFFFSFFRSLFSPRKATVNGSIRQFKKVEKPNPCNGKGKHAVVNSLIAPDAIGSCCRKSGPGKGRGGRCCVTRRANCRPMRLGHSRLAAWVAPFVACLLIPAQALRPSKSLCCERRACTTRALQFIPRKCRAGAGETQTPRRSIFSPVRKSMEPKRRLQGRRSIPSTVGLHSCSGTPTCPTTGSRT